METIRKSLAMFIALTVFSLGLTGVAFAEEIDQDEMTKLYHTMEENVVSRSEELLSDYGMSFEEYEQISQEISRIKNEELRILTEATYGDYFEEQGLDYDSAVYLESIERRYQGIGGLQDTLPKEALEKTWADYLASFDPNEWTANYYKLGNWYNVKFDDGTLVRDYLPEAKANEDITNVWLDFLSRLTVDDHGYFTVTLEDGVERRLLAGFGLKIWTFNDRFLPQILQYLPYGEELFD